VAGALFSGQLDTFLNVRGPDEVVHACRRCFASLFTDRAISYREEKGFDHMEIALSVGVQQMVRSGDEGGGAGVMFSIDTETGFPQVVVINANWGLGETVVAGEVQPDEYRVFKPLLDHEEVQPIIKLARGPKKHKIVYQDDPKEPTKTVDTSEAEQQAFVLSEDEVLTLGRWARTIEAHYERPMDIEWAKDGRSSDLYIVQARPETVQSQKQAQRLHTFRLKEKGNSVLSGLAVGSGIGSGKAFLLKSPDEGDRFEDGGLLVAEMTDPDWGPLLKRAGGIITDSGGRPSHAAIVSRELGVPAVVGTGRATEELEDGRPYTIDCASGERGEIYDGELEYEQQEMDTDDLPKVDTPIMMILATPDAAFRWWNLPTRGVGLARMEFIINNVIKVHPLALIRFDEVQSEEDRRRIESLTAGYEDKAAYFVDHLARGIASIAAVAHPDPAIVRLSDFKTNEYADLIGGRQFEPEETNPMLGFRGAARYTSDDYRDGFALECAAIRKARDEIGLSNIVVMVPFCRTITEADGVLEAMEEHGLKRGRDGLKIYVMAEIPSNIILADEFAKRFDGFSVGSNDLTQLVLGVARDNERLSSTFDERDPAVRKSIQHLIDQAHRANTPVGICGQAPSDDPEFCGFLVEAGIDSIAVNPDSVVDVIQQVAEAEQARG